MWTWEYGDRFTWNDPYVLAERRLDWYFEADWFHGENSSQQRLPPFPANFSASSSPFFLPAFCCPPSGSTPSLAPSLSVHLSFQVCAIILELWARGSEGERKKQWAGDEGGRDRGRCCSLYRSSVTDSDATMQHDHWWVWHFLLSSICERACMFVCLCVCAHYLRHI